MYRLQTNIFIIGLITYGFMAALAGERVWCVMSLASFVAFITQMGLLLFFSREDNVDYSEKTLFFTVLIYTILLSSFFMFISEYYDGDNFLFSKVDAMFYYSESMKVHDIGFSQCVRNIVNKYPYDDWGALVFDCIVMYMVPEKLFLNAIYTVLGALSSLYIYRIGKPYMSEAYAFLAALSYGTSSYIVFFNCTFLKESIFTFIVVAAFYYQYKLFNNQSRWALFAVIFYIALVPFFRPAVAAFIVVSIFIYYGVTQRGKAISVFIYIASIVGLALSLKMMQSMIESNTSGGNLDAVVEYRNRNNGGYSSGFSYFVSFFGSFFGPFPTVFSKEIGPSTVAFYGAGLVYKLFLVIPFWAGVVHAAKERVIAIIPLVAFILVEMVSTGYVCASLELRNVVIHMPFMYVLSYYGMYHLFQPGHLTKLSTFPCYLFVIGILLFWNIIRV